MFNYYQNMMQPEARPFLYVIMVLDLLLKGIALYKSAGRKQTVWFVALLVINSVGILPIIYLFLQKDIALSSTAKSAPKKAVKRGRR
jgi:Family of unknown function (DUF5652)